MDRKLKIIIKRLVTFCIIVKKSWKAEIESFTFIKKKIFQNEYRYCKRKMIEAEEALLMLAGILKRHYIDTCEMTNFHVSLSIDSICNVLGYPSQEARMYI